ncbi:unnamed protein product [Ceratitis capitata]|uniref:(Mediterranean fruit fly) hypothetical protein n=1 Tax=Ceratitis capitata TaxID=7213 RepID=A0A811UT05_CERCA|nr:unnamed protein product [Ceratitis capitata]
MTSACHLNLIMIFDTKTSNKLSQQMTNLISRTKINDRQKKNGGNGSKSEAREDNQVCYNKCSSIVNHKIINKSNYICDNEQSSKSSYFQTNAQVATCLSESEVMIIMTTRIVMMVTIKSI